MKYLFALFFLHLNVHSFADPEFPMRLVIQSMSFIDERGIVKVDFVYGDDKLKKIVVTHDKNRMEVTGVHLFGLRNIGSDSVGIGRGGAGIVLTVKCDDTPNAEGNFDVAKFVFKDGRYVKRVSVTPQMNAKPLYKELINDGGR